MYVEYVFLNSFYETRYSVTVLGETERQRLRAPPAFGAQVKASGDVRRQE